VAVVHGISVYYLKITLAQYSTSQSLFTYNQNDLVLSAVQLVCGCMDSQYSESSIR
jgi:uncharacterized membrane protein YqhA